MIKKSEVEVESDSTKSKFYYFVFCIWKYGLQNHMYLKVNVTTNFLQEQLEGIVDF